MEAVEHVQRVEGCHCVSGTYDEIVGGETFLVLFASSFDPASLAVVSAVLVDYCAIAPFETFPPVLDDG